MDGARLRLARLAASDRPSWRLCMGLSHRRPAGPWGPASVDRAMNSFLASIGYMKWVLPALLLIPLVGATVVWAVGAFQPLGAAAGTEDDVQAGRADFPRWTAAVFFGLEFLVSLGLWWGVQEGPSG